MFETEIARSASRWEVPASWIRAVIATESDWDPAAVNPSDPSYGLMQIMPATARGLGFTGTQAELMEPATNIDLGTKLLAELRERFGTDFADVYSAYNSGDPELWQTSEQVRRNTERAVGWLEHYGAPVGAVGLGVIVLIWLAASWDMQRKWEF